MYQSQYLQDKFINKYIFKNKNNGTFIEIGAYDGITFSNSYFFEKSLNWNGICIEPIPARFQQLKKNRNVHLENVCIGDKNETLEFLHVNGPSEMLSGIIDNYEDSHLQRVDKEISELGGEKEIIKVQSVLLHNLTEKYNLREIDYCSIDVEGSEIKILNSIDFNKIDIKLLSIENNYNLDEIREIMQNSNYIFLGRLEADDLFIKDDSTFQPKELISIKSKLKKYNLISKIKRKLKL